MTAACCCKAMSPVDASARHLHAESGLPMPKLLAVLVGLLAPGSSLEHVARSCPTRYFGGWCLGRLPWPAASAEFSGLPTLFQNAGPYQQMCFLLLQRCSLSHLFLAGVNCQTRLCDGLLYVLPVDLLW